MKDVNLHGTMDAAVWAKEFCRVHGGDEGLMITWFANAIMAGYDEGHRREGRAPEPSQVSYGCHCDLEPGANPDGCVLDYGNPEDCIHAPKLVADGKGREACHEWRPVEFKTPNVE